MPRNKNPNRGTGPKSGKPRKRKQPSFRATKNGIKRFGDGAGTSSEYQFRRKYPLFDTDVDHLASFATGVIKQQRKRGQWFFISLLVKTEGDLYQTTFALIEGDEAAKFSLKWVSTRSINDVRKLKASIYELLDDVIALHVRVRPAWILRVRVVTFKPSNPDKIGKERKK